MSAKGTKITNTFEGGMIQDFPESLQPKNSYRYARNSVLIDRESIGISISNEESNELAAVVGTPVVGHFFVERLNTTFIFGVGDVIGYFDHDKGIYKEVAKASEFGCKWGFNECEWISAEYKTMQPCDELYVYFSSNCTYYRINLTELLNPVRKKALIESILRGNKEAINCDYSCEYFKLFHCVCTPKISSDVSEKGGHKLEGGVYKFAVQLEDKEGNTTNWSEVSQPIYIGSDSNNPGEVTQASINIHLTALDCRYDVVNIAVIDGFGGVYLAGSIPYATNGVTFTYYGQKGRTISLEEIIVKGKKYFRGRSLAQKDSRLYLYNIRQEKNPNLQRRVLESARLKFITIETDVKTAERYNLKSLQRGENYMFGVVYKYCDGTHSPVFLMSPATSPCSNCPPGAVCNGTTYEYIPPAPVTGKDGTFERVNINTRDGVIIEPENNQGAQDNPNNSSQSFQRPNEEPVDPSADVDGFTTELFNWENSARCNDCHPPICCQTDEEGNVTPIVVPGFEDNCAGCDEDENAIAQDGPDFQELGVRQQDKLTEFGYDGAVDINSANIKQGAQNLLGFVKEAESVKVTRPNYIIDSSGPGGGTISENEPSGNAGNSIPVSSPQLEDAPIQATDDVNNIVGDEFGEAEGDTASIPTSFMFPPNASYGAEATYSTKVNWGDEYHNITNAQDLDNNIKVVECWDPIPRNSSGIETTNLYPDSKDCDGNPIYGGFANRPIQLFTTPTISESPIIQPTGKGVPTRYSPANDPYTMVQIRLLGIHVTGVPLPQNDEDWFPKPLCPNEPFRVVMVERTQINSTVQANCLATSTFVGKSGGQDFYYPRHGMCSLDTSDIHVWDNGSHLAPQSDDSTVYNLHGLDTGLKGVGLSASKLRLNAKVNAMGHRYGLYAKGIEPIDRLNGKRIDQRGARQFLNANLLDPNLPGSTQDNTIDITGISYVDANVKRITITGLDKPFSNGYREASVVAGLTRVIDQNPYDASFKMDTMDHEAPIWNAHGWNVSLIRDVPDQYGGVVGMKFIDTGVRANGRYEGNRQINSVMGICGDVYVGPYAVKRTGFVSDKIGNEYHMGATVLLPNGKRCGRPKTVCDSSDLLIYENLDIDHYATRLPKSADWCDARNWAGGYEFDKALGVQANNPYPRFDYYYPKVQKTLILTWLESRANPWKRSTGIGEQREAGMAYYPKLKGMFLDSDVLSQTHPWEDSFLNRFYYRLEQPSKAQLLRKALIRTLLEIAVPAYAYLEASTKQFPTDIVSYFVVLPALVSYWKLINDVVYREDHLNKMVGIQECKTDAAGGEPDNYVVQFEDNYHLYNQQYSVTTQENYYKTMPLNYNTCDCDDCTDDQTTNEIYFSAKQNSGLTVDAYRNFKSFAYGEIGADRGKIKKLFKWDRSLYAHTTEGIFLIKYDAVTNQTSRGLQLLGIGEMVMDSAPILEGITEGIFGIQDPNSSIVTPFGYFFIDREAKRIYRFAGNAPEEISVKGMYNFFKDNLDFCEIKSCHDEKNEGSTYYSMGWDNRYNRLLVTKKSQKEGESFTLSYYPLLGQGGKWGSFHDYVPQSYIWDRDRFYSLTGGKIYKHNKKGDYQRFYGEKVPFEIQFTANLQDYEWFTYVDSEIHTEAEREDVKGIDQTFDKMAAWNFTQGTGTLPFRFHGDNKDTVINPAERIEEGNYMPLGMARRRYTFNGIKDQRVPNCGSKPMVLIDECKYYPRINESIFDCSAAKDGDYIGHTIKDDHLNYRLTYNGDDEKIKFRFLKFNTTVIRDTQ